MAEKASKFPPGSPSCIFPPACPPPKYEASCPRMRSSHQLVACRPGLRGFTYWPPPSELLSSGGVLVEPAARGAARLAVYVPGLLCDAELAGAVLPPVRKPYGRLDATLTGAAGVMYLTRRSSFRRRRMRSSTSRRTSNTAMMAPMTMPAMLPPLRPLLVVPLPRGTSIPPADVATNARLDTSIPLAIRSCRKPLTAALWSRALAA